MRSWTRVARLLDISTALKGAGHEAAECPQSPGSVVWTQHSRLGPGPARETEEASALFRSRGQHRSRETGSDELKNEPDEMATGRMGVGPQQSLRPAAL